MVRTFKNFQDIYSARKVKNHKELKFILHAVEMAEIERKYKNNFEKLARAFQIFKDNNKPGNFNF